MYNIIDTIGRILFILAGIGFFSTHGFYLAKLLFDYEVNPLLVKIAEVLFAISGTVLFVLAIIMTMVYI